MVDRKIAGISQYDYIEGTRYPELARLSEEIERSIRTWFPKFRDACRLDDIVFDVMCPDAVNDKIDAPVLLEINPDVRDG